MIQPWAGRGGADHTARIGRLPGTKASRALCRGAALAVAVGAGVAAATVVPAGVGVPAAHWGVAVSLLARARGVAGRVRLRLTLSAASVLSGGLHYLVVVDVFSRAIVGWSAATSKRAKLVLDALDMALWPRPCWNSRRTRACSSFGCGVSRPFMPIVAHSGADLPAATGALQAQLAHQPGNRAAGRGCALAMKLPPDLPHPVAAEVVGVDPADVRLQLLIPHRAGAGSAVLGGVVGARGDLQSVTGQHRADRLDPEHLLELVDERYERFDGRSSSAAKKAEAAVRISFTRRSSAFSAAAA